jgi:hypothetical protein
LEALIDDLAKGDFKSVTEEMLEQSIKDVRDLNLTDKEDTLEVCQAEAYLAMRRLGCSFGSKKEGADLNKQDRVLNKVTYEEITNAINIALKSFTEDNVRRSMNDQKNFIKPALQYALATRELQPGRCDAKHKV